MRGSPLGAIAVASGLMLAAPAFAQISPAQPAPAKPAPAAKPAPKPSAATPAPRQAPATPAAPGAALDIKGFRSATFGMTPAQVKTAATNDFGPAAKIQEGSNAADGTQFMLVSVDHLDPGPGAAQIGYVFGATSKTLTTINVVWSTGTDATDAQRAAIAQAGQQLAAYFQAGPAPAKTAGVATFGANGLVLYRAADKKNAGVEVLIDGVAYQRTGADNKPVASPPPKGPATLRVSYTQDVDKPDVKTLKPGSF
jgi:hypothetical protein